MKRREKEAGRAEERENESGSEKERKGGVMGGMESPGDKHPKQTHAQDKRLPSCYSLVIEPP